MSYFIVDNLIEFLRLNCTCAHVLAEFRLWNQNLENHVTCQRCHISFFKTFSVSCMTNVRAFFEKPIISIEKPVKYRKSKNSAKAVQQPLKSYIMHQNIRKIVLSYFARPKTPFETI
jgi:protein-arginine kinase activator protein McsA